jgi:hypothetical protein
MNYHRSERTACHQHSSERFIYNGKTYSLKNIFVRINLRAVPDFICMQEGRYRAYVRCLPETQRPYEERPYTATPDR